MVILQRNKVSETPFLRAAFASSKLDERSVPRTSYLRPLRDERIGIITYQPYLSTPVAPLDVGEGLLYYIEGDLVLALKLLILD